MRKEEIEKRSKMQELIDDLNRRISLVDGNVNELTIYTGSNYRIYAAGSYADLFNKVHKTVLSGLQDMLAETTARRDELILCIGDSSYKPVNILSEDRK